MIVYRDSMSFEASNHVAIHGIHEALFWDYIIMASLLLYWSSIEVNTDHVVMQTCLEHKERSSYSAYAHCFKCIRCFHCYKYIIHNGF